MYFYEIVTHTAFLAFFDINRNENFFGSGMQWNAFLSLDSNDILIRGFIMKRLSKSLFLSRLFRINT